MQLRNSYLSGDIIIDVAILLEFYYLYDSCCAVIIHLHSGNDEFHEENNEVYLVKPISVGNYLSQIL